MPSRASIEATSYERWLYDGERSSEANPRALERLGRRLVPHLFEPCRQSPDGFRYRLMRRAGLKPYCRRNGARPTGRTNQGLVTAFERFSHKRTGTLLKRAFDSPPAQPRVAWMAPGQRAGRPHAERIESGPGAKVQA